MTPGAPEQAKKEPEPKPVEIGDEIYVHDGTQPCVGKVVCHGQHGATVRVGKNHHKVTWDKVLGHKRRVALSGDIVDQGEDGMIVQDAQGRRRFIAVPNEATEDPMVAKSFGLRPVSLFLKANGMAPGPGLQQKKITDKNGVQTTRWVTTGMKAPQAQPGQHVGFVNGEHKGHGRVVAGGKSGIQVKDQAGGVHRIRHEHVTHHWEGDEPPDHSPHQKPEPQKPAYQPRLEGENDKAYAKRVVDKGDAPEHLPEEHDRYFNTAGSTHVPLDRLHSTKSEEENQQGGDNGPKRMLAAYHGQLGKRDPIAVMPHASKPGHYEVVDGNGTLTSAKRLGWKGLPTKVVSRDEGSAMKATDIAKDLFKPSEVEHLPERTVQPHNSWDDLQKAGGPALKEFTDILGGIGKTMGLKTGKRSEDLADADWSGPDGFLFIAPLKSAQRAQEKVDADYDGDWSMLCDVVRGTIAVSDMAGVKQAIDQIKQSGMKIAQQPKNRMAKPTAEGYRDMLLIVELPGGMKAELQVNLKSMQRAKSGEGHHEYEVTRSLQGKYGVKEPTDAWSNEDHTEFYRAIKAQKVLYAAAWQEALKEQPGGAKDAGGGEQLIKSDQGRILLVWKTK